MKWMMKEAEYQATKDQEKDTETPGPETHTKKGECPRTQVQDTTSGTWTGQNGEKGPHGQEPQERQRRKIAIHNSTDAYMTA
jgi:hypothetical protein